MEEKAENKALDSTELRLQDAGIAFKGKHIRKSQQFFKYQYIGNRTYIAANHSR